MLKRYSARVLLGALLLQSVFSFAADMRNLDSAFNPAFSLILSGTFGSVQRDPALAATGFAMNPHDAQAQGFNLGESEIGISANIDPEYRGAATLALDPAGGISVENAFVQTNALGDGLNLKFGRFFSGLGYLNDQHAHAWDFVDQPLVYATLWDKQLAEDGLQLKWLIPADVFFEIGGEMGRGRGFPGTNNAPKGSGAGVMFARIGNDIGFEHSWRVGVCAHQAQRVQAESADVPDPNGNAASYLFTGDSQTSGVDLIWKYAPNGNVRDSHLKLQGEYFKRKENGHLSYDPAGVNVTDTFSLIQRGYYVQGVYQFMPRWRIGARYDRLDAGVAQVGALNAGNVISDYAFTPQRSTWMLEYNPSEFSRLRVQIANDRSRQGLPDKQLFVQYVMSLGAHGAHSY